MAQRTDWRLSFVPRDPWRAIGGQTNYVKLRGVEFCGKILNVMSDGIRIEGEWGNLGTVYYPPLGWGNSMNLPQYTDFFVANFPYKVVRGQIIPSEKHLMAWYAGSYTYKTINGANRTIFKLDYGVPCGPNPVLLAAAQKQLQKDREQRRQTQLRRIQQLERDANNGDSSAQYSLGIHYMYGIGCQTNEVKGLFWLIKASSHGNLDASNDLREIEIESTNRPNLHT